MFCKLCNSFVENTSQNLHHLHCIGNGLNPLDNSDSTVQPEGACAFPISDDVTQKDNISRSKSEISLNLPNDCMLSSDNDSLLAYEYSFSKPNFNFSKDSMTIIANDEQKIIYKNLMEFRAETNYKPPSNLKIVKISDENIDTEREMENYEDPSKESNERNNDLNNNAKDLELRKKLREEIYSTYENCNRLHQSDKFMSKNTNANLGLKSNSFSNSENCERMKNLSLHFSNPACMRLAEQEQYLKEQFIPGMNTSFNNKIHNALQDIQSKENKPERVVSTQNEQLSQDQTLSDLNHSESNNGNFVNDSEVNFTYTNFNLLSRSVPISKINADKLRAPPTNQSQSMNNTSKKPLPTIPQLDLMAQGECGIPQDVFKNKQTYTDAQNQILTDRSVDIKPENFIQFVQEKFPNTPFKDIKKLLDYLSSNDIELNEIKEKTMQSKICGDLQHKESIAAELNISCPSASSFLSVVENSFHLSTACRACLPSATKYSQTFIPKFQPIEPVNGNEHKTTNIHTTVPAACECNIPRSPIECPITGCMNKLVFISDFVNHLKVNHDKILMESTMPGNIQHIRIDPRNNCIDANKCHSIFLVKNKIRDLGSSWYKDYLPVLLMTTKICISNTTSIKCNKMASNHYIMIWLTGLYPDDMPLYYTLSAWSSNKDSKTGSQLTLSSKVFSIRHDHSYKSIFNSGQTILISAERCVHLTNNYKDMMRLQVMIH